MIHGCPTGWACVYPRNAGWNGDRPTYRWYYYGSYNLRNQFGTHRVVNNQTGWAAALLCGRYNGQDCDGLVLAGQWGDINLTPLNSIRLAP